MSPARVYVVFATIVLATGLSESVAAAPPEFRARAGLVLSGFGIFGSTSGSVGGSTIDAGGYGNPGFAIGVGARVPLGGRFSLQLEALYERKIGTMSFTFRPDFLPPSFGLSGVALRTTIDYVEFPVTVRYDFLIDDVRPYLFGGAALAAKLNASTDVSGQRRLELIGAGPIDELVHSTDITIVLGAGLEFTNSPWGVEMRASIGLTSVFESPWPNGQRLESSTKTRAGMLLVGYRF